MTRHYATTTEARTQFRALLDGALAGRTVTVRREQERYAVVDVARLLTKLMQARPARALVVREGGGWAAMLQDLPVHGEGDTFDEAIDDLIDALREYAEDWNDHLLDAPNHRDNWDVAEIAELATDEQLKVWLLEPAASSRP
ncbi:MAG: prevent-host-death protein [Sporichthyaceae bacterium]